MSLILIYIIVTILCLCIHLTTIDIVVTLTTLATLDTLHTLHTLTTLATLANQDIDTMCKGAVKWTRVQVKTIIRML